MLCGAWACEMPARSGLCVLVQVVACVQSPRMLALRAVEVLFIAWMCGACVCSSACAVYRSRVGGGRAGAHGCPPLDSALCERVRERKSYLPNQKPAGVEAPGGVWREEKLKHGGET